jgi:2-keto-4-pentenoate hydratase/2-oxohepta-3-ene-1,7-dioic acid hydratase in catechol pathway
VKLMFFNDYRLGVLKDRGRVVDVTKVVPFGEAVPRTAGGGQVLLETVIEDFSKLRPKIEQVVAGEQGVPYADVTVRPPVPRPPNTLCAWGNFQDTNNPRPKKPIYYMDFFHKSATSAATSGYTVELPNWEEATSFNPEPEFAYVVGKPARKLADGQGLDHVFGYLNFADISCHGVPNRWTNFMHKSLEGFAPMGPVITTKDEVPDPQKVRVRLYVNGELKQDYNTKDMVQPIEEQVVWLSKLITLQPGDVVSCGTHHVGLPPINDGDVVELEGEGLERLRFTIKSDGPRKTQYWTPGGIRKPEIWSPKEEDIPSELREEQREGVSPRSA